MLDSSSVKNNGCHLCCICGYIFAILILLAGALSYYIFGIIFLIQDYNVSNECKDSCLWEYVLVSLILSTTYINYKNDEENGIDKHIILLIILGIFNLVISIWGGIELFYRSCDDLSNSNLWIFGIISFGLQLLSVFICVFVFPMFVCFLVFRENNKSDYINNNDVKLTINTNV